MGERYRVTLLSHGERNGAVSGLDARDENGGTTF